MSAVEQISGYGLSATDEPVQLPARPEPLAMKASGRGVLIGAPTGGANHFGRGEDLGGGRGHGADYRGMPLFLRRWTSRSSCRRPWPGPKAQCGSSRDGRRGDRV